VCLQTSTIDGVSCCTICKSPYKSEVRSVSGKVLSLSTKLTPPSISLVVITSHDQEPRLTNMNYQISFASHLKPGDNDNATKAVTIGRSTSQCDMSIKYRTVSSCHAKMEFVKGEFLLSDLKSSNGTLVFVRQPVELAYGQLTHIKLGRTILTMQAKRSWASSSCLPQCLLACTSASQVQPVEVDELPSSASSVAGEHEHEHEYDDRLNATWQIRDTQPQAQPQRQHQEQRDQPQARGQEEEQDDNDGWEANLQSAGNEDRVEVVEVVEMVEVEEVASAAAALPDTTSGAPASPPEDQVHEIEQGQEQEHQPEIVEPRKSVEQPRALAPPPVSLVVNATLTETATETTSLQEDQKLLGGGRGSTLSTRLVLVSEGQGEAAE